MTLRKREILRLNAPLIQCACGCGTMIKSIATDGDPKRYEKNHHQRQRGPKSIFWKGGKRFAKRETGYYVEVQCPNHPFVHKSGYVYEHRLIMEQHLGRYLEPHEHIHHINGIKNDNRIENLQLISNPEHSKLHSTKDKTNRFCVVCGATKTSKRKNGWYQWYQSKVVDGFVCNNCNTRRYRNNKKQGLQI